jgi:hypothetical protein
MRCGGNVALAATRAREEEPRGEPNPYFGPMLGGDRRLGEDLRGASAGPVRGHAEGGRAAPRGPASRLDHQPRRHRPQCPRLVLAHLDAWREIEVPRPEILYWRTADGPEVDFVIEAKRRLLPVEVKSRTVATTGADDVHLLSPTVVAAPVSLLL